MRRFATSFIVILISIVGLGSSVLAADGTCERVCVRDARSGLDSSPEKVAFAHFPQARASKNRQFGTAITPILDAVNHCAFTVMETPEDGKLSQWDSGHGKCIG